MCIIRCSRFVGVSLVPMAIVCMLANTLLLFPNLQSHYLREGHVTREAVWSTGLWASGLLVLLAARSFRSSSLMKDCCCFRMEMLWQVGSSCIALLAAGFCFFISSTGLVEGPLCLHNSTEGAVWDNPLEGKHGSYLFEQVRWTSVCEEPLGIVLWNVVLFSVLMATSGMQVLLCAAQILNTMLGVLCGHTFGRNQVSPA